MTTKTTSALERLRHRFIQDVNFGGHRDSVRFTRDEMNEIIAAFEDEQRQRDERDAKIREYIKWVRHEIIAAFEDEQHQRDERDAKICERLLRCVGDTECSVTVRAVFWHVPALRDGKEAEA